MTGEGAVVRDRTAFLERLRGMAHETTIEMLGDRADGCPYVEAWFERHADTDAATLERMARRYGGTPGVTSADALIEAIRLRMRMGIAYWRSGEDIAGELELSGLHATAGAIASDDAIGGAIDGDQASAARVAAELGDGERPPSFAMGGSAPEARLHTDATAARLAAKADARAFTIGRDVVLAANAPRPGTIVGDILLAHEFAHVQQQHGAPSGRTSAAAAESEADTAAFHVAAARTGFVPVSAARTSLTAPLSLQRCKSANKKPAPDIERDGGVKDAAVDAPADAALPPGKRSWVGSSIVKAAVKSGTVSQKDFTDMNQAAKENFGEDYVARLIEKMNPSVDPRKIGPRTKFEVPTSIELPTAAEKLPDNVDDSSSVAYWTWKVEEDPRGTEASFLPSVPSGDSGVTLGRGYDMKARSANEIQTELELAGIDKTLAKKYRGAAKLSGKRARDWIVNNKPFNKITAAQDKELFLLEYQQVTDKTMRFFAEPTIDDPSGRGYQQVGTDFRLRLNLSTMNPVILAFLVDLRFRGDLGPRSWGYIREAVEANDLERLRVLVGDVKKHQDFFYDNWIRYAARCRLVGIEPVDKATFEAKRR